MDKGVIVHTIVFNDENKILIIRRTAGDSVHPGYWDIPGGTLNNGEDPVVGAIREAKEESGLELINPSLFFQKSNIDTDKNKQFITLVFLAKYSGGDVAVNMDDHDEFAWIDISDQSKYQLVSYLPACFDLLASKKHSILGF